MRYRRDPIAGYPPIHRVDCHTNQSCYQRNQWLVNVVVPAILFVKRASETIGKLHPCRHKTIELGEKWLQKKNRSHNGEQYKLTVLADTTVTMVANAKRIDLLGIMNGYRLGWCGT